MKLKKQVAVVATVVGAATVAIMGLSAPASASYTSCEALPYWVIGSRTCKTGEIHSNANHDLRIIVRSDVWKCTKSPWTVWDVYTGRLVASGSSLPTNVVINGLYGTYRGRLNDACYRDTLVLKDY